MRSAARMLFAIALTCLWGAQAHAQPDTDLERQIRSWRKGDAPPARLLKFPDGKIETTPRCDLRAQGSEVSDYVSEIQDTDLLSALLFHSQAEAATLAAAASRLIGLKGVGYLSSVLAQHRRTDPGAFARSELAVLTQLVRSPYVAVQVARIAPEDMPPDAAERALKAMQGELRAGSKWADAYSKHSQLHPDLKERAKNPKSVRTLVSYLYEGTVAPTGFDLVTYGMAESLPLQHLAELFRAKGGTHVLRAGDGVYLYHVSGYYAGAG